MKIPITYALHNGQLTSIHSVPSGLACACVCSACLQPLIARKGAKMTHHFAHHRGEECAFAAETMFHRLAKEILAQKKHLNLPALCVANYPAPIFPAQLFSFDKVWLEHRTHDIIPDLFGQSGNKKLFIEIALTHPSPLSKQKRIKALGIATVEIDLRKTVQAADHTGKCFDDQLFRKSLLYGKTNRHWLFNPKKNALEAALLRRSERKRVKQIGQKKRATLCAYPCPKQKRHWKRGPLKGQSYAQVFRDCLHCPYCLKIEYQEELRAYQWVPTLPKRVYCWAREKEWMEQFVYPNDP